MVNKRIAIILSHPIQHFCPQFTNWSRIEGIDLKVFFASKRGLNSYHDRDFGRLVQWDGIKLDFPHEFLPGADVASIKEDADGANLEGMLEPLSPKVVVIYGYSQRLQRRAARWAHLKRIPVLMIGDSELKAHRSLLERLLKMLVLPRIFERVEFFLTVGDANESYYRKYGVPDYKMIRCSFPIDIQHSDAILACRSNHRNNVRLDLGIPATHKVLITVGKLVATKRQCDLILLSNAIQSARSDITVLVVGAGPEEEGLRRLSDKVGAGGVIFAGFVSPENLAKYYCAGNVYVHCSEIEAHSLAISEAVYCGLPVVISDACGSYGPTDDVRHGVNGLVYSCGNISELAGAVHNALREGLHLEMSDASFRIGKEHQKLAHGKALLTAINLIESIKKVSAA